MTNLTRPDFLLLGDCCSSALPVSAGCYRHIFAFLCTWQAILYHTEKSFFHTNILNHFSKANFVFISYLVYTFETFSMSG